MTTTTGEFVQRVDDYELAVPQFLDDLRTEVNRHMTGDPESDVETLAQFAAYALALFLDHPDVGDAAGTVEGLLTLLGLDATVQVLP